MSWFHALLLIPTAPLVWEDFRRREVGAVWLVLLGGGALAAAWMERGITPAFIALGVNALLLLILTGALWLWLRLRGQRFERAIGAGDVAFMLAVTPLPSPSGYVWFLLVSCVAALVACLVARWKTIPLVGVMGCVLTVYILYTILWN